SLGAAASGPATVGALPGNPLVQGRAIRMINCRHASRLLSNRLDRPLSWFESLILRVHLLLCASCRRFGRASEWLHRILTSLPSDVRLPSAARERIRIALEQAARDE